MKISRYRSKIDIWLGLLLALAVLLPIGLTLADMTDQIKWSELVKVLPAMLLPLLIVGWIVITTDYTFNEVNLVIRSGPFRWIVPFAKIDEVKPSRTLISNPALSLDRLEIRFNRYEVVAISPERREAFLAELDERRAAAARSISL
jgi:hypothetical protein